MKLVKKVTAGIAMAALCCTMVVPMGVNAGNGTGACFGHDFHRTQVGRKVLSAEYYIHSYTTTTTLPDGEKVSSTGECRVQLIENYYEDECWECGYIKSITEQEEEHMSPCCPVNGC